MSIPDCKHLNQVNRPFRAKPLIWKQFWFAWKWSCRKNTFSYEWLRTDSFWHRDKRQLGYSLWRLSVFVCVCVCASLSVGVSVCLYASVCLSVWSWCIAYPLSTAFRHRLSETHEYVQDGKTCEFSITLSYQRTCKFFYMYTTAPVHTFYTWYVVSVDVAPDS